MMKTLVVGAGGGGIASALLGARRGEEVTLIEAHSALGGCASWFRRGKFIFDAGATTLSGVQVGEPLGELFELLGRSPSLVSSDPGIVFHLSCGKKISYYQDFEKWMRELSLNFPHLNHRSFWEDMRSLSQKGWRLLRDVEVFPFKDVRDFIAVLKNPDHLSLVFSLGVSVEHLLKIHGLYQKDYVELINGILLISAQAECEHIPVLVGAMALTYPGKTYASYGGMKGVMDFFESELLKHKVEILKNSRVIKFSSKEVHLSNGKTLQGERLILNLPVWNLSKLSEGNLQEKLLREAQDHPGHWGAFTLYFGANTQVNELYHQIHLNHSLVKNYFVSFSIPDDHLRAPLGYQAVSISTHVDATREVDREDLTHLILNDFKKRFSVSEIKFLTSGTPRTFERYTGRMKGFVGGLPFLYGKNPFSLLSPLLPEENIFRVGDTVFPGQGLCGVVAGALGLHRRLTR